METIQPVESPFSRPAGDVVAALAADATRGLTTPQAVERLRRIGPNRLRQQKPKSAALILAHQFKSIIVWLLAAAALFSLVIGDTIEAAAIALVLVLNGAIGFFTEYRAARSMEALIRIAEVQTRVRRDGIDRMIDARDIVPGDLVVLEAGDVVTADLRLIETAGLQCEEAVLTGEALPVEKTTALVAADAGLGDRQNMAFKGTAITQGAGLGVVVATGMNTAIGEISGLAQSASSGSSPLEDRLEQLGRRLIWLTLVLALATIAAGVARGHDIADMIQTGVALAIAAIPEGLPVVATLALARGMWRMAQQNAVINRLSSVETLGATTLILTDKTGTLTENRMAVECYLLDTGRVEFPPAGETPHALNVALSIGALCTNAGLEGDGHRGTGDPMELALLRAERRAGTGQIDHEVFKRTIQHAFDPSHRMMATVNETDKGYLYAVKGAPEAVIARCTTVLGPDGPRPLTQEARHDWIRNGNKAARSGYRNLGIAMKTAGTSCEDPYADLTLIGLACLSDPLRADIPPAIEACHDAGIEVVMVTGDHADTATRIAQDAGIADPAAPVISGRDLDGFDPAAVSGTDRERLRRARVFARIAPATKLALVTFFQGEGDVVAMTGDGVNDAPALKKADIGIAMGQRGTQVAKEAAHMVLKDDDFATIVDAVRQGRVIFGNIRKFVVYLMSCNLSEVVIVGLAVAIGLPAPLLPLQILFLNLVTDVFPAFALGMGRGDGREMSRPPRDAREPIVSQREWIRIALLGVALTCATLAAFGLALYRLELDAEAAVTVAFLTLALGQLWNVFNVRAPDAPLLRNDVMRNPFVWGALALCVALVAAAIYVPLVSSVLRLPNPGRDGLTLAALASFAPLAFGQIILGIERLARWMRGRHSR